jgi:hypothetical protein
MNRSSSKTKPVESLKAGVWLLFGAFFKNLFVQLFCGFLFCKKINNENKV